jgi:gamma-glutamylaminecyclotransferase
MNQLFVFGTLKQGFPNFEVGMNGLRFVGRCRTCEAYPLVVAGEWFSPVLIFEAGLGSRVFGELFEVDDAALERLDFFEHVHLPMGHNRLKIAIEMAASGSAGGNSGEGILDAWAYMKNRSQLAVIHSELTDEYHHDPRYVLPADRPSGQ